VSLDAATGKPDPAFGERGRVSLGTLPSGERLRDFHWSSAPLVCGDTIVVGQSTSDAWTRQKNEPGTIRGFDVRNGSQLWTFYIVPRKGEEGYDSWQEGSADYTGAGNVWSWMSCDQALGRVFAATSTPSNDWYGGHRKGSGLFAETIVALDARTGEKAWHFQAVHHGLWDYDFPAAPILADIEIAGTPRKLLAQVSKQAFLYVFDRVTGEPIWPILELPVPASDVPGEHAWPTQPHPSWPLPYDRQGIALDDLIDFTPELRQMALEYVAQFHLGPVFAPPTLIEGEGGEKGKATLQLPGPVGGTNWNGAALDRETGILFVPSVTVPTVMGLRPPPDKSRSDLRFRVDLSEADGYAWATLPNGLPITKPPYGRVTAIDLKTGRHLWMVPNGEGPRDHPALRDLDLPRLGHAGRASPLVTATLLFLADGTPDMPVVPPWAGGRMFRAYDKSNGDLVWEYELPAGASGAPMTYMFEGKQYIVVPVSEREHEGELIAFALPDE
jgi:quinoprotein glucose dehydrogenase